MKLKEPSICKIREVEVFEAPFLAKVAVSGDWHISPIVGEGQYQMLKEALSKIQPELIILQGDLIDDPGQFKNPESVEKLRRWFQLCISFAPTVMVLGSHDYIGLERGGKMDTIALRNWQKICKETEVQMLNDKWFETEHIKVFGMFQSPEYCLTPTGKHRNNPRIFEQKLKELSTVLEADTKKVRWFVAHAPDMTKAAEAILVRHFDVASFGHTHGGCLPRGLDTAVDKIGGHGGIISPTKRPLPSDVRGVRKIGSLTKIINAGMVATQNCAPKLTQYLNFAKAAEITSVKIGTRKLA